MVKKYLKTIISEEFLSVDKPISVDELMGLRYKYGEMFGRNPEILRMNGESFRKLIMVITAKDTNIPIPVGQEIKFFGLTVDLKPYDGDYWEIGVRKEFIYSVDKS